MSRSLLESQIKEIQIQYLDLLKTMLPMLDDEKYLVMALDSISLFWRKKKPVIDIYLKYIAKEQNAVFYTAATYFDVENGEQYPFLLMGNLHIFDDPLGKYCEICHRFKDVPQALSEKVLVCAKDNIDILEKCEGLVVVLPLRFMGTSMEEKEFHKLGEKTFLSFFKDIPDIETYFKTCDSTDAVIKHFKDDYQDAICLYENDSRVDDFRIRVEHAAEMTKAQMGEGYSMGEYFYFCFYGSLQQAIDILLVSSAYNATPLIRYPVSLHNAFLLISNFYDDNFTEASSRLFVYNNLYKMFDQSLFVGESLSTFYARVRDFSFESKACACYQADNLKETCEKLHVLIKNFEKAYRDKYDDLKCSGIGVTTDTRKIVANELK